MTVFIIPINNFCKSPKMTKPTQNSGFRIYRPNVITLLEYGLPRQILMLIYGPIVRLVEKGLTKLQKTDTKSGNNTTSGLAEELMFIKSFKFLIQGGASQFLCYFLNFLSSYLEGFPSFIQSISLHLSPPPIQLKALVQMFVPSGLYWRWQSVL